MPEKMRNSTLNGGLHHNDSHDRQRGQAQQDSNAPERQALACLQGLQHPTPFILPGHPCNHSCGCSQAVLPACPTDLSAAPTSTLGAMADSMVPRPTAHSARLHTMPRKMKYLPHSTAHSHVASATRALLGFPYEGRGSRLLRSRLDGQAVRWRTAAPPSSPLGVVVEAGEPEDERGEDERAQQVDGQLREELAQVVGRQRVRLGRLLLLHDHLGVDETGKRGPGYRDMGEAKEEVDSMVQAGPDEQAKMSGSPSRQGTR